MNEISIQTREFVDKIQQGQLDDALQLANELSQKAPEDPAGYMMLGDALMQKGEHEKATHCYYYSLEKDPNQPSIYIALGEAYMMIGETGKAYENYYYAVSLAPEDSEILQKTGSFLVLVGRFTDAQNILRKALALGAKKCREESTGFKDSHG